LTGLIVSGILPWAIAMLSFQFLPLIWGVSFAVIINGLTFYFSLGLYNAEFDRNFLYLTRRLNAKQIDLKEVEHVKAFPIPIYLYFGHAYILSIAFRTSKKSKKVFTISKGSFSWTPTIDKISEISLFREYIQSRKYGR